MTTTQLLKLFTKIQFKNEKAASQLRTEQEQAIPPPSPEAITCNSFELQLLKIINAFFSIKKQLYKLTYPAKLLKISSLNIVLKIYHLNQHASS